MVEPSMQKALGSIHQKKKKKKKKGNDSTTYKDLRHVTKAVFTGTVIALN
jgi:hypothetical protein